MNTLIPILTITLPLLGGVIGYFVKHNIDKKRELLSEVTRERREHYQQFVNIVIDLFRGTKTGKQQADTQHLSKLFDFYKKYVLYASPEVINNFSDYFQYLYTSNGENAQLDNNIHFRKLSKIMKAMRTDLGLSNKNLGDDGERIFRALLTDFDKLII